MRNDVKTVKEISPRVREIFRAMNDVAKGRTTSVAQHVSEVEAKAEAEAPSVVPQATSQTELSPRVLEIFRQMRDIAHTSAFKLQK